MAELNIGKNLLIVGVVLGIAAAGLGAYSMSSSKVSKLNISVSSSEQAAISALTGDIEQVNRSLARGTTMTDVAPKGATLNGKPRFTPLFYAPELWQVAIDGKNVVMDIHDPGAPSIHGDVPNSWFIENGLQDVLGVANALELDSDGDGFTNAEEKAAGTKPMDAKSFPALVGTGSAKLEVVRVIREKFVIQVDSTLAFTDNPEEVSVKIFRKAGDAEPIAKFPHLKPNANFGAPGSENRYTVLGFERATFHDASGSNSTETALKLRDNVTLSPEKEFLVRAGNVKPSSSNRMDKDTANEKGRRVSDSYAVLRVTAGPKANTPEAEFRVAEKGTFSVPGAENIVCTLESIDAAGSVNIHMKGAESSVPVPMAASAKPAKPAKTEDPAPAKADAGQKPANPPAGNPKRGKNRRN